METGAFIAKIEKIKTSIRIVILAGTVFFLAGLFVWLVYLPKAEAITKTKGEIGTLQVQLNRAKLKARKKEQFEAEFAEVNAQFQEALRLLPNKKETPSLLRKITQLGTDSNLEFRLFSPQKERDRGFYMEIPVSIEVSGNYHDVAVFFDKVGRMERIVNILDVDMKPIQRRSTSLITKCNAVTYRFKGGE